MPKWLITILCWSSCLAFVLGQTANERTILAREAIAQLQKDTLLKFGFEEAVVADLEVRSSCANSLTALTAELEKHGLLVEQFAAGEVLIAPAPSTGTTQAAHLIPFTFTGGAEPLISALVFTPSGLAQTTNAEGQVFFTQEELSRGLIVRYLGYEELYLSAAACTKGGAFTLERDIQVIPEVLVREQRITPLSIGTMSSTTALLPKLAGSEARALLTGAGFSSIAGVSSLDTEGGFSIRGSADNETLITLDQLPLQHISHYYNLFSAINPDIVEAAQVYRSHYPIRYDGVRGGLIEFATLQPDSFGLRVAADPMSAKATAELRAGEIQALASARATLWNVPELAVATGGLAELQPGFSRGSETLLPNYNFYDGYVKLTGLHANRRFFWAATAFQTADTLDYQVSPFEIPRGFRENRSLIGNYSEGRQWSADAQGLSVGYRWPGLQSSLKLHRSAYQQRLVSNGMFALERLVGNDLSTEYTNNLSNTLEEWSATAEMTRVSDNLQRFGVQVQSIAAAGTFQFNTVTPLDLDDRRTFLSAFTETELPWQDSRWGLALRTTYIPELDQVRWSPRLSVTQAIAQESAGKHNLQMGYSLTNQFVQAIQHENQFGQTYELFAFSPGDAFRIPVGHNLTAGYGFVGKDWSFTAEAYGRYIDGVLANVNSLLGAGQDTSIINVRPSFATLVGRMRVLGVDLDLAWQRGNWSGSMGYTLSASQQQFPQLYESAWLRAPDDRRHRLTTRQEWLRGKWTWGLNAELASGPVFTDIIEARRPQGRDSAPNQQVIQQTLPAYFRVDGELAYTFYIGPAAVDVGLSVLNVFNRENFSQRQYILELGDDRNPNTPDVISADLQLLPRVVLAKAGVTF